MAARRDVACPSCGALKSTAANRGVRLVCVSCGEAFRCPGPAEGAPAPKADEPAPPAPTTAGRGAPAPTNGVTVSRAKPVIRQTARPRERGLEKPPATPPPAPVVTNPAGRTGPIEKHVAAGRRGGLASYARQRRGRL